MVLQRDAGYVVIFVMATSRMAIETISVLTHTHTLSLSHSLYLSQVFKVETIGDWYVTPLV